MGIYYLTTITGSSATSANQPLQLAEVTDTRQNRRFTQYTQSVAACHSICTDYTDMLHFVQ